MGAYFLFSLVFGFLACRFFRPGGVREKFLIVSLTAFSFLTLALHPWVEKSYGWLSLVEKSALISLLLWLMGEPWAFWLEKRRREKRIFFLLEKGKGPLGEIVTACRILTERHLGGLIAVERKDSLDSWIQLGVSLDAKIRREIIVSIFTPPGALHDGGTIIRGERIAASGVVFPLSKRLDLPTELGTRHRAGLGLSEVTDAFVIIVSEETGKISLAVGAKLLYDVKSDRLAELLERTLKNKSFKRGKKASNDLIAGGVRQGSQDHRTDFGNIPQASLDAGRHVF